MSSTPEQDKYLKWYYAAKKEGLVDVKYSFNPEWYTEDGLKAPEGVVLEDLYKELNDINDALAQGKCEIIAEVDEKGNFIEHKEFF